MARPSPCRPAGRSSAATGKPGDGLVSRWLNRPISQRAHLAGARHLPGIRPIHVTVFNALLAVPMFLLLLFGGHAGLILGAILFQAASVLDGVDGEMARATFRTSAEGASLDSLIDMSINFLFVLGLTIHLAVRDQRRDRLDRRLGDRRDDRRQRPDRPPRARARGRRSASTCSSAATRGSAASSTWSTGSVQVLTEPRLLRVSVHGADPRRAGAGRPVHLRRGRRSSGSSTC